MKLKLKKSPLVAKMAARTEVNVARPKPGWMRTNPAEQDAALKESLAMASRNRPPEFWLNDGDEKTVRFRHANPVATVWRYSLQVRGKWRQFTAPADGEVDLFRDSLGLTPTLRAIYEVIDIGGFRDKQGKRFKNVPRFFVCNQGMFQQLQAIGKKRGPLNQFNMEITRSGQGTKTTYMFLPEAPSPMPIELKSIPFLKDDIEKYYAPLDEQQQQALVAKAGTGGTRDTDDDEDDE